MNDKGKTVYKSGASRSIDFGRGHFELLPPEPIRRVAILLEKGAKSNDPRNWEKGFPWSRCARSLLRHAFDWLSGDTKEDHLAAIVFNAFCLMEYEKTYPEGNDIPSRKNTDWAYQGRKSKK